MQPVYSLEFGEETKSRSSGVLFHTHGSGAAEVPGGGFRAADITAYFKTLGRTAPTVSAVSVDKGKNAPSNANSADGEVMLDIEVAAAVAPGAKIVVYFTPNTDQGFTDAISSDGVTDGKNHVG